MTRQNTPDFFLLTHRAAQQLSDRGVQGVQLLGPGLCVPTETSDPQQEELQLQVKEGRWFLCVVVGNMTVGSGFLSSESQSPGLLHDGTTPWVCSHMVHESCQHNEQDQESAAPPCSALF